MTRNPQAAKLSRRFPQPAALPLKPCRSTRVGALALSVSRNSKQSRPPLTCRCLLTIIQFLYNIIMQASSIMPASLHPYGKCLLYLLPKTTMHAYIAGTFGFHFNDMQPFRADALRYRLAKLFPALCTLEASSVHLHRKLEVQSCRR